MQQLYEFSRRALFFKAQAIILMQMNIDVIKSHPYGCLERNSLSKEIDRFVAVRGVKFLQRMTIVCERFMKLLEDHGLG